MPRVRIVHWKPAEADALIDTCRAGGFEVEFDPAALPDAARTIRRTMPDALVIDLTRMPSHGRELAFAMRRTKYTRQIPIVFVDGEPEKVEAIRRQNPTRCLRPVGSFARASNPRAAERSRIR
jgi:CheY-like chemotaxis protein